MGFVAVTSRALKETPTQIIIFYNTILGILGTGIYMIIEQLVTDEDFRMKEYTLRQFMIALGAGVFDFSALYFTTFAY